ncbi:MmcQ/YjbR family DNA-binding protein [Ichthyenterobacterium sp. W332]|uniref:MmcQ/YjbR family DNA-binding protein n=1 Tax=Microcosmobacter mediterraneus TaxID=3075607 RepID=A0ABU2YM62_9FLAO|nr:MmcQ/YjbR family DNA-binding protein [Ichthyenterobacterium sp. W332]MDT0558971.1 MmcQ/YjbR family DNA-binding protein [Ichthyenterobacterium sp. W332]
MNIEQLYEYCLSKKAVTEHFPFDDNVLVFKVLGKMFLLTGLDTWEKGEAAINVKCDPDYAEELRAEYQSVEPGYHMSKKHWNTLRLHKGELSPKLISELIDHSYDLVVKSLPKRKQEEFREF